MLHRVILVSLLGLTLLLSRSRPVAAQPGGPAGEIFRLVNGFRAQQGLPQFRSNAALNAAAQQQAEFMAANNVYSHSGWGGSTPYSRAVSFGYSGFVSENIVGGTDLSPREGLVWWQNSPVHLNTLLATRYVEAGAGFAQGYDQNFYALVVGRPADSPAAGTPRGGDESTVPVQVTPIQIAPPRADGSIVHVVQTGQTAWAIAARYDVSLDYLLLINSLGSGGLLRPGDEIYVRLAEGQAPPPTPTPPAVHVVQEGETAWSIAAQYGLSLYDLLWYNSLNADAFIRPGDELKVRLLPGEAPPPTPTPQLTHRVESGETLWEIALVYNLTLDQLLAYNGLTADAILHPGDALRIRPLDPTPTTLPPTATATPFPSATPETILITVPPRARASLTPTTRPTVSVTPAPAEAAAGLDPGLLGVGAFLLVGIAGLVLFRRRL